MFHIKVLPYGPSDSVSELVDFLNTKENVAAQKLRRVGSIYRPRSGHLLVNYGNRSDTAEHLTNAANSAGAIVLNTRRAINLASNKVNAFNAFRQAGVPTVDFTTRREEAEQWVLDGNLVYARTVLNGHSGEGIVIISNVNEMVDAPLYTKGITAQRREFRIHVMNGVVTYIQQKRRRDGYQDLENFSMQIRNHHTGWIYATSDINVNQAGINAAIAAINALGLDFGAVDIITRRDDAWVLEVNTAPGLTGTNLETFANNLVKVVSGEPLTTFQITTVTENESSTNTTQVEQPQESIPEPEPVVEQEVPTTPAVETIQPVNGSVYICSLTDTSERVVLMYNNQDFWFFGLEIPVSSNAVTIIRQVDL